MECWEKVQEKLIETINIIFKDYDISSLNAYEIRKIIFRYLTNTLAYDFNLLENIKRNSIEKIKIARNPIEELECVINNKIGICNSISQYYKLLLEIVGIKSYAVICDDGTEVNHQLNLVYDVDNDLYSFDDITSVIVGRGSIDEYFDYDLEFANYVNQGNKTIMDEQSFVVLPEEYINYLVNREESLSETLEILPNNIVSLKNKLKVK